MRKSASSRPAVAARAGHAVLHTSREPAPKASTNSASPLSQTPCRTTARRCAARATSTFFHRREALVDAGFRRVFSEQGVVRCCSVAAHLIAPSLLQSATECSMAPGAYQRGRPTCTESCMVNINVASNVSLLAIQDSLAPCKLSLEVCKERSCLSYDAIQPRHFAVSQLLNQDRRRTSLKRSSLASCRSLLLPGLRLVCASRQDEDSRPNLIARQASLTRAMHKSVADLRHYILSIPVSSKNAIFFSHILEGNRDRNCEQANIHWSSVIQSCGCDGSSRADSFMRNAHQC